MKIIEKLGLRQGFAVFIKYLCIMPVFVNFCIVQHPINAIKIRLIYMTVIEEQNTFYFLRESNLTIQYVVECVTKSVFLFSSGSQTVSCK